MLRVHPVTSACAVAPRLVVPLVASPCRRVRLAATLAVVCAWQLVTERAAPLVGMLPSQPAAAVLAALSLSPAALRRRAAPEVSPSHPLTVVAQAAALSVSAREPHESAVHRATL
jgi:hypothetical protein